MKYTGYFKSLKENSYKVEIITNGISTPSKEITLASDPVTITTESDGLLSPIKSRSCSITIVTKEIYYDMYAASAKQNEVLIYKENSSKGWDIIFEGYVTPGVYNQKWSYIDKFTIECCDKISVLQYFNYEYEDYVNKGEQLLRFKDYIIKALNKAGYSNYKVYFPKYSTTLTQQDTTCILNYIYLSESNLFDDDDEHTPWTYEDLLTEICNYLGLSITVHHNNIYFVDYQVIGNYTKPITGDNMNAYWVFDANTSAIRDKVITYPLSLTKNDIRKGTPDLSLEQLYNKIQISCSLYAYDEDNGINSNLFDTKTWTNITSWDYYGGWGSDSWASYVELNSSTIDKEGEHPYTTYIKFWIPNSGSNWSYRYFESNLMSGFILTNPTYGPHTLSGYNIVRGNKKVEYTDANEIREMFNTGLPTAYGDDGLYAKYEDRRADVNVAYYHEGMKNMIYKNAPAMILYKIVKSDKMTPSVDWENVLMFTPMNFTLTSDDVTQYQVVIFTDKERNLIETRNRFEASNMKPVLNFKNQTELRFSPKVGTAYFTFDFKLLYQQDHYYYEDKKLYSGKVWTQVNGSGHNSIIPIDAKGYAEHKCLDRKYDDALVNKGWPGLKVMLKIGNKYWNGSIWTTTESTFDINVHKDNIDKSVQKDDNREILGVYMWNKPVYNVQYNDQNSVGEDKFAIPIKDTDELYGAIQLTIYTPYMPTMYTQYERDGIHASERVNGIYYVTTPGTVSKGGHEPAPGAIINEAFYWWGDEMVFNYKACPQHIFMKDLEFNYVYNSEDWISSEDEDDDDIVYSNVINESYVEEYDELELKINSQVNKKPMSKSYTLDSNHKYIQEVYCPATSHSYLPEENLIEKIYNHHSSVKKIFNMDSLFNDSLTPNTPIIYTSLTDKPLCLDALEIHLSEDTNKITLYEY